MGVTLASRGKRRYMCPRRRDCQRQFRQRDYAQAPCSWGACCALLRMRSFHIVPLTSSRGARWRPRTRPD